MPSKIFVLIKKLCSSVVIHVPKSLYFMSKICYFGINKLIDSQKILQNKKGVPAKISAFIGKSGLILTLKHINLTFILLIPMFKTHYCFLEEMPLDKGRNWIIFKV